MSGNSKGVKNSWETRRAKYGPSGRAPKPEGAKPKKHESRHEPPSRYMNKEKRDVRTMNGVRLPPDHQLEMLAYEREEVVKAINFFNRYKKTVEWRKLPAYVRESYQAAHNQRTGQLRNLNKTIRARQKMLLDYEHQKHGRR